MNSVPRGADVAGAEWLTEGVAAQAESIATAASVTAVRATNRLVEDRIMIG
jgi:hypothetical protein